VDGVESACGRSRLQWPNMLPAQGLGSAPARGGSGLRRGAGWPPAWHGGGV
jgi:hypothetical protein